MNDFYIKRNKKFQKPVSASVVPAGCVMEFFDSVSLFKGGREVVLEKEPTFRVRSFMNSIRYRNLVAATKMNSITIHSLEPFDTYMFESENKHINSTFKDIDFKLDESGLPF